jgi:hypothetical protein
MVGFWFCFGCSEELASAGRNFDNPEMTDENGAIEGSNQTSNDTFCVSDDKPEIGDCDAVGLDEDTEATTVNSGEVNSTDSDDVADTPTVDSDEVNPADDEKGSDSDADTDTVADSDADSDAAEDVDAGVREVSSLTSSEKAIAIGNCRLVCFTMASLRIVICRKNNDTDDCESKGIETTQACSEKCAATDGSGYEANAEVDEKDCPNACVYRETTAIGMCLAYTIEEYQKDCRKLAAKNKGECLSICP